MPGTYGLPYITVHETQYTLKGLVRCVNGHFTSAVHVNFMWHFIDDLCDEIRTFQTIGQLYAQFSHCWFFGLYVLGSEGSTVSPITWSETFGNSQQVSGSKISETFHSPKENVKQQKGRDHDNQRNLAGKSRKTNSVTGKKRKLDCHISLKPYKVVIVDSKNKENMETATDKHSSKKDAKMNANFNFWYSNISKFHDSMEMRIIQCCCCSEAWPIKIQCQNDETYICSRCKRDKLYPRKFSAENNMKPSPVLKSMQKQGEVRGLTKVMY